MITRLIAIAALLLFQRPDDTPEEGKPLSCDNYHRPAPAQRCACGKAMHSDCGAREPSVAYDSKCKTVCRVDHCHCLNACTTGLKRNTREVAH